jgi:uroporphyrinogen-III synthase
VKDTARILSTKKLAPNQKQFLLNAGFSVIEADFIRVEFLKFDLENNKDSLIFTSQNAVRSILENKSGLSDKHCFCVGAKTKELLEVNGFNVIRVADNAEELAQIITSEFSGNSFTFFTGNLRLDLLPKILGENKIVFNEVTVYETNLVPMKVNTTVDGILFFSPSAVESFLIENEISDCFCFCIGQTTARALNVKNIVIANQPTVENVIIQCINHYK